MEDPKQLIIDWLNSGADYDQGVALYSRFGKNRNMAGKNASVSEVIRAGLRLLEIEEKKSKALVNELKTGEKSRFVKDFDRNQNLKNLHAKYLDK